MLTILELVLWKLMALHQVGYRVLKSNIITFKEAQMVIVQDNNGTPQDTTDDGDQLYLTVFFNKR